MTANKNIEYLNKYKVLRNYLIFISSKYNLQITVYDYSGFIALDSKLRESLRSFYIHSNDYCMYIKSKQKLWDKCLEKKNCIAEKCRKEKSVFFGSCHAGVEEYIIPVFNNEELISFISAGVFRKKKNRKILSKIADDYQLDLKQLQVKYVKSLSDDIPNKKIIISLLEIISVYLSQIYAEIQKSGPQLLTKKKYNSTQEYILQHVLVFIHKHYKEDFTVQDLTKYCHCSESYLNHLFKNKIGINIRSYINNIRIEEAKKMLVNSKDLIKDIATSVGYNDPNYFSKVFKETCKTSATEFRKNKGWFILC